MIPFIQNKIHSGLPFGPVAKTPCCHWQAHVRSPISGQGCSLGHMQYGQKKKKNQTKQKTSIRDSAKLSVTHPFKGMITLNEAPRVGSNSICPVSF